MNASLARKMVAVAATLFKVGKIPGEHIKCDPRYVGPVEVLIEGDNEEATLTFIWRNSAMNGPANINSVLFLRSLLTENAIDVLFNRWEKMK